MVSRKTERRGAKENDRESSRRRRDVEVIKAEEEKKMETGK